MGQQDSEFEKRSKGLPSKSEDQGSPEPERTGTAGANSIEPEETHFDPSLQAAVPDMSAHDSIPLASLALDSQVSGANIDSGAASTIFPIDDRVRVTVDQSDNRLESYTDATQIKAWEFGRLLEATHPKLHRRVQLLVLDPPHSTTSKIRDPFLQRVREVASLHSPFIEVGISEAVVDGDLLFLVLQPTSFDRIHGFQKRTEQQREQSWFYPNRRLASTLMELALALETIHRSELIHGAITPDDLRINDQTGVATLTGLIHTQTVVEAPEQYNAAVLDRRKTDLRDLAISFVHVLDEDIETTSTESKLDLVDSIDDLNPEVSPPLIELLKRTIGSNTKDSILSATDLVQRSRVLAQRDVKPIGWIARLGTLLYELVLCGLLSIVGVLASVTFFESNPEQAFSFFAGGLPTYLVLSELFSGATLARRSRGIQLLERTGFRPTFMRMVWRMLIRNTLIAIPAAVTWLALPVTSLELGQFAWPICLVVGLVVLYSTAIFTPDKRPLHDRLSGISYGVVDTLPLALTFQSPDDLHDEVTEVEDTIATKEISRRVDQYDIRRQIGRGGMGTVYEAIDQTLNRPVALKAITPHLAKGREALRRFAQEARIAAQLSHQNVAKVYGVGNAGGQPYLVMEYVAGETLQQMVMRRGALTVDQAWELHSPSGRWSSRSQPLEYHSSRYQTGESDDRPRWKNQVNGFWPLEIGW